MPKSELNRAQNGAVRAVTSQNLLQGARELLIQHGAELYRLRVTNQGKLILTK